MPQKSKKQARKVSAATRAAAQRPVETVEPTNGGTGGPKPTLSSSARSSGMEFNPDYSQTIKDLKRIGILAGGFFTILIILSFFLR